MRVEHEQQLQLDRVFGEPNLSFLSCLHHSYCEYIYIYINIYKYISRYSNSSIKIIRAFPTKYAICPLPTNCIDNIQQNLNIELKNNILKRFITPISRPTKVNCNIHFYNFLNQLTQLLNHFKYSLTSCNLSLTSQTHLCM